MEVDTRKMTPDLFRRSAAMLVLLCLCAAVLPWVALAGTPGGALDDPMVMISGAPLEKDADKVLAVVAEDVCGANDLDKSLVTFTWQDINHIRWNGGKTTTPVFVELYVPGFFTNERVAVLMESIADALVLHAGAEWKFIFIHTHVAEEGRVWIDGGIMEWTENPADP